MPTPSEQLSAPSSSAPNREWAARSRTAPASVFGNYGPEAPASAIDAVSPASEAAGTARCEPLLQTAIEEALARSFLYRFLAQGFADPSGTGWEGLCARDSQQSLQAAVRVLARRAPALTEAARAFQEGLCPARYELFLTAYLAAFGHAARGRCPLNEIEYGDIKADPLFQPHRLADLAAFYRAFGLEVAPEADERHDHVGVELEFMCVLAAKEAYALEHQLDAEQLDLCRDAQKKFLREHLGRWTPAFTRRLARETENSPLAALANLTRAFVEAECARFQLAPGSEELLLRPVDEAAESLCSSCGGGLRPPPGSEPPGEVEAGLGGTI